MRDQAVKMAERFVPGGVYSGFTLERAGDLGDMRLRALEFRHLKSGARLLHLAADDPENLFAVAFRTPPPDDAGLPHIIEHSVLCGSRRYPVKDPFVELLKTSLATFLNAFTYPDRTVYPCASLNRKDFHNLLRVYADAVFFPLLSEDHLRQEGHHLEFPPGGRPRIKGVVYNEMRGVYSDPASLMERHLQRLLFASNAYGRDYGGDPERIPALGHRQYLDFHRTYYHPANAWLFTYGDADIRETLALLDGEFLGGFRKMEVDSAIAPLERWSAPRRGEFKYPLDAEDSPAGKTDIAVAFAANDRRDVVACLAMRVVDYYLLDNAASPLRKALIDSRLGEDLGDCGYADHQRDTFFTVILKGSEPERAEAAEKLVLDVLRRECEAGFAADRVGAALRQFELAAREIRPQYPLHLMERAFGAWLYGSDPLGQIQISARLAELRLALAADRRFLENQARKWLLDNPHRLRIVLAPDVNFRAEKERETEAAVEKIVAGLGRDELAAARATAARLEAAQSAPNSPEALATLPRLAMADVSPEPIPLDFKVLRAADWDVVDVPMYAGGIGYLDLRFSLSGLEGDDLDFLPLFCEALAKTGAAGLDYAAMAEREAASVGALDFAVGLGFHVEGAARAGLRLGVWLKALEPDWDQALSVLADRLFQADFSDLDRLRDIILQSRTAWRSQIIPSGNSYASLYAASRLNPALAISERLSGCSQARFVERLASDLAGRLAGLPGRLAALRDRVLAGAAPAASHIGSAGIGSACRSWLETNANRFGGRAQADLAALAAPAEGAGAGPLRVGLAAPAEVAFAAQAVKAPALAHPDAPALVLLGMQLSFGHLWNEVRVKGGAYGVRASFDGSREVFTFSSFRDPNIFRTFDSFASCPAFVAGEMDLSPAGLEQAIIGAVKVMDQPLRPAAALSTALTRHLAGEDEAFRRAFRRRLLSLTAAEVRGAAERLFAGLGQAPLCALASREKLAEENGRAGDRRLTIEPLWEK
ncbi:MAG: insulinase family protein [Planctomycetota bacterium]|jgi:Zn-dependent M16 (insulinase) family peptidase|nr:insulinase family protein [Planctomycetota bacterium]